MLLHQLPSTEVPRVWHLCYNNLGMIVARTGLLTVQVCAGPLNAHMLSSVGGQRWPPLRDGRREGEVRGVCSLGRLRSAGRVYVFVLRVSPALMSCLKKLA